MKLKKVLAAVMAITISMGTVGVRAADYGQDIDDKKSKIEETRDKIDKLKDLVDENQRELDSKSDAIAKIEIEKISKKYDFAAKFLDYNADIEKNRRRGEWHR